MRILLAIAITLLWSPPAQSSVSADAMAVVEEVIDGSTMVLDRPIMGSRVLRLAGIEAPQVAQRPAHENWPLAEEARQTLAALSLGHQVRLSFEGLALDRYRRLIAQVHDENGRWLQGEMVARGMAWVRSLPDNRSRLADLLVIEAAARAEARGIWANPFYRVRSPDEAKGDIDSFQIVEGVVIDRARIRDRIYLNFGPDWRTDFTVSIETRLLPAFEKAALDPMDLKGRTIRVRGWIESRNGPFIDATHPEQIEVLPEQPPDS
jgi:endonuclease YncB( thermonuclease family)